MSIFYLDPANLRFQPGKTHITTRFVNQSGVRLFEGCVYTISCLPLLLFVMFMMVYAIVTALNFLSNGIITDATVEVCVFEPSRTIGRGGSNANLNLTYRYSTASGMVKDSEMVVNNYINCDAAPVGSTIQIQYVPGAFPNSQVIDDRLMPPFLDRYAVYYCAFPIMLIFTGVYVFLGVRGIWSYFKARRLAKRLRDGVVLSGKLVEASGKTHGRGNSLYHVYVKYQFVTPAGVELSGKQRYRREDLNGKPLPESGTPVKILYVADDCYVML